MNYEETIRRPDPRRPESWCREGVAHDHGACGSLWNSVDALDMEKAARWTEQLGDAERKPTPAADLPEHTIVAFRPIAEEHRHDVAIKRAADLDLPWQTTNGYGGYLNAYRDDEIDDLLAEGRAQVLRVGVGM